MFDNNNIIDGFIRIYIDISMCIKNQFVHIINIILNLLIKTTKKIQYR